jgi:ribonuclease E
LRLRDLAGLIVIDFIDMEQRRHNLQVERRLKESLQQDRARIQVGTISHFGLLEMSRQRLRPSLTETSLVTCPHCGGLGHVRSTESAAIHVLRAVEEEGAKRRAAEIAVHAAQPVVLYVLNNKRTLLAEIETRFGMRVGFQIDPSLTGQQIRIERVRAHTHAEAEPAASHHVARMPAEIGVAEAEAPAMAKPVIAKPALAKPGAEHPAAETPADGKLAEGEERKRRRRRRRRGGSKRRDEAVSGNDDADAPPLTAVAEESDTAPASAGLEAPIAETAPETIAEPVATPAIAAEAPPAPVPEPAPPATAEEPAGQDAPAEPVAAPPGEEAPKRRARAPRRAPAVRRRKTSPDKGEALPDLALPGAPQPDMPPPATPAGIVPELAVNGPEPAAAGMIPPDVVAEIPPEASRKRGWWQGPQKA